jgi:NB-ARC domain/CHAT domain
VTTNATNPFIGPQPFRIGDRLYGRDWEIGMLYNLLLAKRLVLLHSPSGAGKTSLIQAGLWPKLEATFRVNPTPIRVNIAPDGPESATFNRYIFSTLQSLDPTGLKEVTGRKLSDYKFDGDPEKPELWIFDQFEEVLSLDPTDEDAKRVFFEQLAEIFGNAERRCWALFAMREDYLGALETYLKLLPTGVSTRFRLELLDSDGAREAILGKATEGVGTFAEDALETLIGDLRKVLVQRADGRVENKDGPFVEPVQLQVVCQWLWNRAAQRATPVSVVRDDVVAPVQGEGLIGGMISGGIIDLALSGYYAGRLSEISNKSVPRERRIRDWLDLQLITNRGLRSQVMRGQESQYVDDATVKELIRAWLIREEPRGGRIWLELSHDRLIKPIQRDNLAWRKTHLSQFQTKFEEWRSQGRPADLLLRGAALLQAETWVREHSQEIMPEEHEFLDQCQQARGRAEREQGTNLEETGWGVIFVAGTDGRVRTALRELCEYRRDMAKKMYRELQYQPGETTAQFLARHGAPSGQPDPEKLPYYLLLVGDPQCIPYELQYGLDVQYAVGRLYFETAEEYASYARSVIAAETGRVALSRQLAVFAPQNPDDLTSEVVQKTLVDPLLERLARVQPQWNIRPVLRDEALKDQLVRVLGGPDTPALLFTATHGLKLSSDDTQQLRHQGALVCQDWPGPLAWTEPIPKNHYFAGDDVGQDARLLGLIAFIWGEYSAGTPQVDDFAFHAGSKAPEQIAPRAFVARLPQRLLGHPAGGALAVIGHVDRTKPIQIAESASNTVGVLKRLMTGYTVGAAMDSIKKRHLQLAVWLGETMRPLVFADPARDRELDQQLRAMLTATIDARNYVVLGDPATHLPIDPDATTPIRPTIDPVWIPAETDTSISVVGTPTVDASFLLEIELRRASAVDGASQTGQPGAGKYVAVLKLQRPGETRPVTFEANVEFDLGALQSVSGDPLSYGRQLGRSLLGQDAAVQTKLDLAGSGQPVPVGSRRSRPALYYAFLQARSLASTLKLPLRVQLTFDPRASELQALYWETLCEPDAEIPLLVSGGISFARHLPLPALPKLQPRVISIPRALVAVANSSTVSGATSGGLKALARQVWIGLSQATKYIVEFSQAYRRLPGMSVTILGVPGTPVTSAALLGALREAYDVIYLVCHAALNGTGDDVNLILETSPDGLATVTGQQLAQVISELSQAPRLIVLVPWPSLTENDNSIAVLAPILLNAGVAAIVSVQGRVSYKMIEDSLDPFLRVLFSELVRDGQIDRAVAAARASIHERPDWWVPILYRRTANGRLFQVGPRRVAEMPVSVPKDIINRPALFDQLMRAVTSPNSATVGLIGFTGCGTSTLARIAYNDARVQAAFPDGRLWVTLGRKPSVIDGLRAWITALGGDPSGLSAMSEFRAALSVLLADRRVLLVIDDALDVADVDPFLTAGVGCVHLVTGHDRNVLPPNSAVLEVGPMETEEAVRMLGSGLELSRRTTQLSLLSLAGRLCYWPAMLRLANGLLRERVVSRRQVLEEAVNYLSQQSSTAFDLPGSESIAGTIEVSLKALPPVERDRMAELVIFPEGVMVSAEVVQHLWHATAGFDVSTSTDLIKRLISRSLLSAISAATDSQPFVQLHPVLRPYLLRSLAERLAGIHGQFLDAEAPALRFQTGPLKVTDNVGEYLRDHLIYHLIAAGRTSLLGSIIFANGVDAETGDYLSPPVQPDQLIRRIISESEGISRSEREFLKDLKTQAHL